MINEHNAENHSYELGLNVFADMTNDEFTANFLGYQRSTKKNGTVFKSTGESNAEEIDWRVEGAVNEVKN